MNKFCGIIGQSNSIMRNGFFNKLRERNCIEISKSARLGASPSVIGPYLTDDVFFDGLDFCIIDLCVVDFAAIWGGADYVAIYQWIDWIGHMARKNNCQPIFVLIPVEPFENARILLSVYEWVVRENKYFYIDLRELVLPIVKSEGVLVGSLYSDGSHIGSRLSIMVADVLERFFAASDNIVYKRADNMVMLKQFDLIEIYDFFSENIPQVRYDTSLVEFKGLRLSFGTELSVDTGAFKRIHAIMVNAASSHQSIEIIGSDAIVKGLALKPYSETDFEARVIPICTPMSDCQGKLRFKVSPTTTANSERTMQAVERTVDSPKHVEIAGILVERANQIISYSSLFPEINNILKIVDFEKSM